MSFAVSKVLKGKRNIATSTCPFVIKPNDPLNCCSPIFVFLRISTRYPFLFCFFHNLSLRFPRLLNLRPMYIHTLQYNSILNTLSFHPSIALILTSVFLLSMSIFLSCSVQLDSTCIFPKSRLYYLLTFFYLNFYLSRTYYE